MNRTIHPEDLASSIDIVGTMKPADLEEVLQTMKTTGMLPKAEISDSQALIDRAKSARNQTAQRIFTQAAALIMANGIDLDNPII
jgi:hypothetical protein